jgi:hypothetical protein
MLIGFAFWLFSPTKSSSSSERNPNAQGTAQEVVAAKGKRELYIPNIPTNQLRSDEEEVQRVEDVAEGVAPQEASLDINADFENTRLEITRNLANGDLDMALNVAQAKLLERSQNSQEVNYIAYLHDFILQNSDNPDQSFSATISALRASNNQNVKKFLYDRYVAYAPDLAYDLDRELQQVGVVIEE